MVIHDSIQQDVLIPISITLGIDSLSNDIHSKLLSSPVRKTYLIYRGIEGRVPMGHAYRDSFLVTLLMEDSCKFLEVPNGEKQPVLTRKSPVA